ncbi:MAG: class I SAM-dependent methyltransferase [Fuerstiella sp.]
MPSTKTASPVASSVLAENDFPCPVCKSGGCVDAFEATGIPIHVGICGNTPEEARSLPTGDVVLSFCRECGFLHNRVFDPGKLYYRPGYEVALHHSPTFVKFMDGVTTRLMKRFELQDKRILEIGCGGAYFLRMLAEFGDNNCIGYDPTVTTEGLENIGNGSVELVRDYFGPKHSADADFICCLLVFENITQPVSFLKDLRKQIGDLNPGIYFEVFNAFQAISSQETWSINYEQVNWFSRQSLSNAFEQAGFTVSESGECYEGGQYVFVDAVPGEPRSLNTGNSTIEIPHEVVEFASHHQQQMELWTQRLKEYEAPGRRVVVWGAGGKGISFLNQLPSSDAIPYVVDINPDKRGTFIPGSAQEIVSPEFLAEFKPETIILMNALYQDEIRQQVKELGLDCEFLIA